MKNLLTLSFLLTFVFHSCHSQDTSKKHEPTRLHISQERSDSLSMFIPRAKGFINDFVQIFTIVEIKSLDSLVSAIEKKTTIEIAVATVNTTLVKDKDFEDYTLVMMRKWGVGKKDKNNGILIVISSDLRKIRIQNGYGIENILSNAETKYIVDNSFIPQFKKGNFFEGTRDGIIAIVNKLKQNGL